MTIEETMTMPQKPVVLIARPGYWSNQFVTLFNEEGYTTRDVVDPGTLEMELLKQTAPYGVISLLSRQRPFYPKTNGAPEQFSGVYSMHFSRYSRVEVKKRRLRVIPAPLSFSIRRLLQH
jgi:hypothetical protein